MLARVSKPYFDKRARVGMSGKADRPWVVVVRHGATGSLIDHKRFATEDQALAYYQEMSTTTEEPT